MSMNQKILLTILAVWGILIGGVGGFMLFMAAVLRVTDIYGPWYGVGLFGLFMMIVFSVLMYFELKAQYTDKK